LACALPASASAPALAACDMTCTRVTGETGTETHETAKASRGEQEGQEERRGGQEVRSEGDRTARCSRAHLCRLPPPCSHRPAAPPRPRPVGLSHPSPGLLVPCFAFLACPFPFLPSPPFLCLPA